MTQITYGIGDLARLSGVTVRTIRFYSDQGLLSPLRSGGGHRRFDAAALDRLQLLRRLRGLGMGLPAITAVLDGQRSIAEAVAAERAALDVELAALAWRRASLRALEDAGPARRAAYLELLAAVSDGRAAHDTLVGFWQRISIAEVPPPMFDDLVAMVVPDPPVDPTPEQVVAYAELVALVGDRSFLQRLAARARVNARELADEVGMLRGVSEACALADPLVRAGERPGPGQALDRFVAAHADGRRRSDTPAFRRELSVDADVDRDPRMRRYWALAGEVLGEKPDPGAPLLWLVDALEVAVRSA